MIRASIYGRLGGDPVERTTRYDNRMATTSIAVSVARHGEDELTEWVNVAAFGKAADALMGHAKGDLVVAMGPMVKQRWTGRDGQPRESWSLTAESIVSARTVRPGGGGQRKTADGDRAAQHPDGDGSDLDDEIPF
ncbi:MAG TPA: single-stranded DNA-binding protein [Alphaproteobacteria bacterium]|nr:single-stranded DNA-binding protein [Alphaproteobacteria bacterium]